MNETRAIKNMRFRYINVYQIRGLIHNPDEGDTEVYAKDKDATSIRCILTGKPDQYCYELDRAHLLSFLMLAGSSGERNPDDIDLEIKGGIERIREDRKKELENSEALIFIVEGETEADFSHPTRETNNYIWGFDIIEKDNLVFPFKDQINAVLAALCLSTEQVPLQIKHIKSGVYLINEFDKPVYSVSCSVSGEGYSSIRTAVEIVIAAQGLIKPFNKQELKKVCKLFTQAISRDNDDLRRFMFGWAALETFVKNVFSEYEKVFIQLLLDVDPTSQASRYFKNIRKVMKGKYNILDQFVVVAACIAEGSAETDIQEFTKIKNIRDNLFHRQSLADKDLPNSATVELLKKYLRLHIKGRGQLTKKSSGL